jgi:hypothetical protein
MKNLTRRSAFVLLSALSIVGLGSVLSRTMASQNPRHGPEITNVHFFVKYSSPGTGTTPTESLTDQFTLCVTLVHSSFKSNANVTITGLAVSSAKVGAAGTASKTATLPSSSTKPDGNGRMVAVFRFQRSLLRSIGIAATGVPAIRPFDSAGTGTFTFTVSDPTTATVPDSTATLVPTQPDPIDPCF